MKLPQISQDDLIDVIEMMEKMEEYISAILNDQDQNIAMSALMSCSVNCMLAQCNTVNEAIFYRNIFMQILDNSIRNIQIKNHEKPPSS